MKKPIGCDQWTGHMPDGYCDRYVPNSMFADEVTDEVFCPRHAGPLMWSARLVNLYSAALRIGAYVGMPVKVPTPGVNYVSVGDAA